jgi:hypothetical protein
MKFELYQELDYVQGHLRYGHRKGIVEVESEEELKQMIEDGDLDLDVIVDDYEIDDWSAGDNKVDYKIIK